MQRTRAFRVMYPKAPKTVLQTTVPLENDEKTTLIAVRADEGALQ